VGRLVGAMESAKRDAVSSPLAWGAVTVLAVVAFGNGMAAILVERATDSTLLRLLASPGNYGAAQCAALLAGLLLQRKGVAFVFVLMALFWWLEGVARANFQSIMGAPLFPLAEAVAVVAFGVLGMAVRSRVLATSGVAVFGGWGPFLLVVVVGTLILLSPADLIDALTKTIAAALFVALFAWARRRWLGWLPSHGGWTALLALASLTIGGILHWETLAYALNAAGEWFPDAVSDLWSGEEVDAADAAPALFLVVAATIWIVALMAFLRRVPDCVRDVRTIRRLLFRLR
jgi:hypothetical protein